MVGAIQQLVHPTVGQWWQAKLGIAGADPGPNLTGAEVVSYKNVCLHQQYITDLIKTTTSPNKVSKTWNFFSQTLHCIVSTSTCIFFCKKSHYNTGTAKQCKAMKNTDQTCIDNCVTLQTVVYHPINDFVTVVFAAIFCQNRISL